MAIAAEVAAGSDWTIAEPARNVRGRSGTSSRLLADRLIAAIDKQLAAQVDAIVHHPRFQRLEGLWRAVSRLIESADGARGVKIKVLSLGWNALARDLERSSEFDQSQIFQKIYTEEFDMPGGEPYGLIVADYEPSQHPRDIAALRALAGVAAASFTPMVFGVSPRLFDLQRLAEIAPHLDLTAMFSRTEYSGWTSLRRMEDARFLAFALPRVLARLPYRADGSRADGFVYNEAAHAADGSQWLWCSAGFAFAAVVIRCFGASSWFSDIRGTPQDTLGGGVVDTPPQPWFATDRPGIGLRHPVEASLSESHERELSDLGFMPLLAARLTPYLAFYGNQSLHQPPRYDRPAARANAKLSAMLQQVLCASRFAHYVKVIVRDKIGSFKTAHECENQLNEWLLRYCMGNDDSSAEMRARYPLRDARSEVREIPGKPGHYNAVVHLQPHFQLDEISTAFRLVTIVQAERAA